jgi:hypothetical protein
MSFILILIGALFTLSAIYFTIQPFLKSREEQARLELIDEEIRAVELLLARKEALVRALRELEFDHSTEKITAEDYERYRLKLERQAIGVMRELDAVHGGKQWREKVDAYIQDNLPELEAPPEKPERLTALACKNCGATLKADDRFCAKCGERVQDDSVGPMGQEVLG